MRELHATPLQALILQRLLELGGGSVPMPLTELAANVRPPLHYEDLRAFARGERGSVLTQEEVAVLADVLRVPLEVVEGATTVLPSL